MSDDAHALPVPSVRSLATEEQAAPWMDGSCHVLAVALHRAHGWRIHLALDEGSPFWEDPEDADNCIPSVLHAYAVDPDGMAWDARGARPLGEVESECKAIWHVSYYGSDELRSEGELRTYVGCWGEEGEDEVDRPLAEYGEEDVAEAQAFAESFLGRVEGYPAARAPGR